MEALIEALEVFVAAIAGLVVMLGLGWWLVSFFVRVFRGEPLVITDQDRRFVRKGLTALTLGAAVVCICSALSSRRAPSNPPRLRIGDD